MKREKIIHKQWFLIYHARNLRGNLYYWDCNIYKINIKLNNEIVIKKKYKINEILIWWDQYKIKIF